MRIIRFLAGLIAIGSSYFYGLPFLAPMIFRGDGSYQIQYNLPGFHEYKLVLPPVPLSENGSTNLSFFGFYTNHSRTHVSFCVETPEPIPTWELTSEVQFSFGRKGEEPIFMKTGRLNGDFVRIKEDKQVKRKESDWVGGYRKVYDGLRGRTTVPAYSHEAVNAELVNQDRICYSVGRYPWPDISWLSTYVVNVDVLDADTKFEGVVSKIRLRSYWTK